MKIRRIVKSSFILAALCVCALAVFAVAKPATVSAQDSTNDGSIFIVPAEGATNGSAQAVTPTPVASPDPSVNAQLNSMCQGANFEIGSNCNAGSLTNNEVERRFTGLVRSVVDIFSIVVGVVAVFMIIIGGLRYITSGGDSSNVSSAKNTILYVLVGLVVVAMSQVIVRYIIARLRTAGV